MRRYREPVALVEAAVFGVAGVVIALLGPWPWLAILAGPLIAVVVLVIATWQRRDLQLAAQKADVAALIHRWADDLPAKDPAEKPAREAVALIDEIEELVLRCNAGIEDLEPADRDPALRRLSVVEGFIANAVDTYTAAKTSPKRPTEWSTLATRLRTARNNLQTEVNRL